jgi:hypothetical protein
MSVKTAPSCNMLKHLPEGNYRVPSIGEGSYYNNNRFALISILFFLENIHKSDYFRNLYLV